MIVAGAVRIATPADCDAIASVTASGELPAELRQAITAGRAAVALVSAADDRIVGVAAITPVDPGSALGAEIEPIAEFVGFSADQVVQLAHVETAEGFEGQGREHAMCGELAAVCAEDGLHAIVAATPADDMAAATRTICMGFEPFSRIEGTTRDQFSFYRTLVHQPYIWPATGQPEDADPVGEAA